MSFNLENLPPPPTGYTVYGRGPLPDLSSNCRTPGKGDLAGIWVSQLTDQHGVWEIGRQGLLTDWVYAVRDGSALANYLIKTQSEPVWWTAHHPVQHEF